MVDVRVMVASLLCLGAGLGLAACSGPDLTGTLVQRASAWSNSVGFSTTASHLSHDQATFARAAAGRDQAALQETCTNLEDDASMGAASLPTPDSILTSDLNRAYDAYYRAGQLCLATVGKADVKARLAQAAAQLAQGPGGLRRAQSRLSAILGP